LIRAGLCHGANCQSRQADCQKKERKPGSSHEHRSILRELPAAIAALGSNYPGGGKAAGPILQLGLARPRTPK